MDKAKSARITKNIVLTILLVISLFWFVFALLSGAEEYGGGIHGILMNSPNAIPWLVLFVFVIIAWRWNLIGGILIGLIGVFTLFFFNAFREPFALFAISLPLIIMGGLLIWSWYLVQEKK